jgi:hypothetical protein
LYSSSNLAHNEHSILKTKNPSLVSLGYWRPRLELHNYLQAYRPYSFPPSYTQSSKHRKGVLVPFLYSVVMFYNQIMWFTFFELRGSLPINVHRQTFYKSLTVLSFNFHLPFPLGSIAFHSKLLASIVFVALQQPVRPSILQQFASPYKFLLFSVLIPLAAFGKHLLTCCRRHQLFC